MSNLLGAITQGEDRMSRFSSDFPYPCAKSKIFSYTSFPEALAASLYKRKNMSLWRFLFSC